MADNAQPEQEHQADQITHSPASLNNNGMRFVCILCNFHFVKHKQIIPCAADTMFPRLGKPV
jgi:hypothetical protein